MSIADLPVEVRWQIALETDYSDLPALCATSTQFRQIWQDASFWQHKARHDFETDSKEFLAISGEPEHKYLTLYRSAVQSRFDQTNRDYRERLDEINRRCAEERRDLELWRREIRNRINRTMMLIDSATQRWIPPFPDLSVYHYNYGLDPDVPTALDTMGFPLPIDTFLRIVPNLDSQIIRPGQIIDLDPQHQYFVFEYRSLPLEVEPIIYHILPSYAVTYLEQANAETLDDVKKLYPNIPLVGIRIYGQALHFATTPEELDYARAGEKSRIYYSGIRIIDLI